MAKLVAFGDSFTWGAELKDSLDIYDKNILSNDLCSHEARILHKKNAGPYNEIDHEHKRITPMACYSKSTWPSLLANYLNRKYVCYAIPGGSNQSIIRKVIQYAPYIEKHDYVIINWTYIDRWDFIDPQRLPIDDQWQTIRPTSENKTNFEKFYFKYIRSELWNKWNSLKEIMLASNILQNKNIKFMMTCVDNLILDDIYHTPSYVKNAQDEIKDNIIWFDGKGFNDWCTEHKFPRGKKNDHPLEEAHIAAFEYIKDNHDFTK